MEVQQGHNNKDVPGGQSYSKPAESMRSNKQPEGLGHSWPTSCLHTAAVTLPSVPSEPHHLLFLSLLPLALASLLSYSFSLIFQLSLPMIHFITRVACLTTLRTQSPGIRALQFWATLCVSRHLYCKKVLLFCFLPAFFPRLQCFIFVNPAFMPFERRILKSEISHPLNVSTPSAERGT